MDKNHVGQVKLWFVGSWLPQRVDYRKHVTRPTFSGNIFNPAIPHIRMNGGLINAAAVFFFKKSGLLLLIATKNIKQRIVTKDAV